VSKQDRSPSRTGRKLKLRARAERQEQTRQRIVEAAVELHQRLGPLATTVTAIADRAGVERLTVYRHFPEEELLIAACTAHYFALNPPPKPEEWIGVEDPEARLRHGLGELYAYWDRTESMMSSVLRDHEVDPERAGRGAVAYMRRAKAALTRRWGIRGRKRKRLDAAVGHAVHFFTWRSLVRDEGLRQEEAVQLMVALVLEAAGRKAPETTIAA
jgi:AcrR family transcriptional regulator